MLTAFSSPFSYNDVIIQNGGEVVVSYTRLTQLTTQVWTSLIFLHHTATNLLNATGSEEFGGHIRPNQTKTAPSLSHT